MKAAPQAQQRLLDLQALDTAIAQLDHRRRTLPETAQASRLQAERARVAEQVVAEHTVVSDLEAELAKAESDLVPVRERRERNQKRIDTGAITDPKALSAMLEEIAHLDRRTSDLEDLQLEAMERLDGARAALAEAEVCKRAIENEMRATLAMREARLGQIAAERAQRTAERSAVAAAIPAELLTLYSRVAEKSGGVGAAPLHQRRCGGCQLQANAADLARYRAAPDDEVLRCEECNRILVRTPESGL